MNKLYEIEKIKQLKYRYFRGIDANDWELYNDCLTEDCKSAYSDGKLRFENSKDNVAFMSKNMSGDKILTMHNGHHPEIELISDATASGIWYLQDIILDLSNNYRIFGTAIYSDEYRKVNGEWKISSTSFRRIFEYGEPIGKGMTINSNMFASDESLKE